MTGKVCAKCRIELRPKTNDIVAIEMADFGPYKIWAADLWGCPECGAEVILGFANHRMAEHYEPKFATVLQEAERNPLTVKFWQDQEQKELTA